ncbi:MAG: nuclear transport factor 2 family protein [Planctomycetota bacterium]
MNCTPITSVAVILAASQLFAVTGMPITEHVQAASAAQAPASPPAKVIAWPKDEAGLNTLATGLLEGWFQKMVSKDRAGIEAGMQPNFQRINFEGSFDRTAEVAAIASLGVTSPKISGVRATRVGDALVVTCLVKVGESLDGKKLSSEPAPRLAVWQQVNGAWQLAAWASLEMPAVRPAPTAPRFAGDAALNATGSALLAKLLNAQHTKDLPTFDGMLAEGFQVVNFKGQKERADMLRGAKVATTEAPTIADARTTQCGDLMIVTCNLTMGQKVGWDTVPADPAPFLAVFQGSGAAAKAIALANTNKPK